MIARYHQDGHRGQTLELLRDEVSGIECDAIMFIKIAAHGKRIHAAFQRQVYDAPKRRAQLFPACARLARIDSHARERSVEMEVGEVQDLRHEDVPRGSRQKRGSQILHHRRMLANEISCAWSRSPP